MWTRQSNKETVTSVANGGFVHEIETTTQSQASNNEQLPSEQILRSEAEAEAETESTPNHVEIEISNERSREKSSDSVFRSEPLVDEVPSDEIQSTNDTNSKSEIIEMEPIATTPPQEKSKTMTVAEYKPPLQRSFYLDHSKLDEISSVEDIRHTIIERREPNGTISFVEADTIVAKSCASAIVSLEPSDSNDVTTANQLDQSYELSELEKIELEKNIMERVLNQTDIEQPPTIVSVIPITAAAVAIAVTDDFASDDSSMEDEREVRAIVHASNSRFNSPMYTPPPTPITPPPSLKHKLHTFEKRAQSIQTPNFRIGSYEAAPTHKLLYENDQSRRAFKSRLESLFSQNEESRSLKSQSPVSRYSQRLLPFAAKLNHSMSAPESLVDSSIDEMAETKQESLPPMSAITTAASMRGINGDSPSEIPSPPVFNQQLYDTIGRNRKAFSSMGDVIDIDGGSHTKNHTSISAPNTLQKFSLQRAEAHENLTRLNSKNDDDNDDDDDDEIPNIAAIRQKLENIFSKGRTIQADVTDLEQNQNENVRRSKRHELFDTVRMQKMRFSSVLKTIESIGSDNIHANLHQTHTTAANDIQQEIKRRESLSEVHSEQPIMKKSEENELNAIVDETMPTPTPTKTIE